MTTEDIAKKVIDTAKAKHASFCEVAVTQNEFSLKRIKRGSVDQPPAAEQWGIDVALYKGKRKKAVSFDNPLFIEQIISDTLEQIEFLPEQELILPEETFPAVSQPKELFDNTTAQLNDQNLLDIAQSVHEQLQKEQLYLSGKVAQSRGELTYQNSYGTLQQAQYTLATAGLYAFDAKNQSVSSYASSGGTSINDIHADRLAQELITKSNLQRTKEKVDLFSDIPDGKDLIIDVIVEPYFLGPVLQWLGFFGFNGLLVERGESFMSNNIGKQITGKEFTLSDDPFNSENKGMGFPFDFEGRPRKKVSLIEKGVAKNATYDTELAHTWNKQPTGNALPPSMRSEGAAPFDIAVEGGTQTIEHMIQNSKEKTLWITKPHYLAMKHGQTATMTGIVQHGTFLIENGQVVCPVENLRFEQNMIEAFSHIESMSKPQLVFDPIDLSFPTGTVTPAMKIKQFRFIGSTKRST